MDLVALRAELDAGHPVTGPYSADPQDAANEINAQNVASIRASMTGAELWANTDPADYAALSDSAKAQWLSFCAISDHDTTQGGLAQQFVVQLFGGGSATVAALATARQETVSQATALDLGSVRAAQIKAARAL